MTLPGKVAVEVTANFEANLATIEAFWNESGFPAGFDRLLDELTDSVIPKLESYPRLGPDFLQRRALSMQERMLAEQVAAQLAALNGAGSLREFIMAEYIVLYAELPQTIHLLSIKHHRQLSFDFGALWPT